MLVFVEFEGPYDWANQLPGGAKVISSKKLVRLEESAPWRVEDADSFDRWLALFAAGKHDEVTKELEDTLPKAPGLFGLFAQQPLPPHEQLWHRIEKDAPYRAELVVRAWAAAVRGDANLLDEWLATQQIDFTSPQAKSLEDVRLSCWVKQRDFARAAVMLLDRTPATKPLADLERLGDVLESDKQLGGVLWQEARFAEAIAQGLDDSKLSQRTRARWLFLQGEDEAAFDVLENAISEPGELAKAELEKLANMYLWRRMMSSTDQQVLLQAYDLVRPKLPEQSGENMYLAHTLACAEAQTGKLKEALGYVSIYGTPEASNELVRGLVLQRLGFDALAQELFQRVIDFDPSDSNAVIARLHLRANPANGQGVRAD